MRNISTVESRDNATLSALSAERGRYFREMEGIYRSLRDDPTHMLSPSELDRFDEISNHVLSLDRQVAEIRGIPFDSVEDEAMNNIPLIMPREDLERIAKDMAQPPKEFRRSMRPCVQSDSLSDGLPSDIAGLVERNGRVSFAVAKSIRDLRAIQRTPLLENGDTGMLAMPVEMLPPVSAYRMPMPWLLELIPTVPVSGGSVQQNRIDYASPSGNAAAQVPEGALKPESTIVAVSTPVVIPTWAHWMQTSTQALSDSPSLYMLLDGTMTWGIREKINNGIVAAMTTAGNFTPFAGAVAGENVGDGAARAAATLAAVGGTGIVIALNPQDLLTQQLAKATGSGVYLGMPPGIPAMVVGVPSVPVGQVLGWASEFGFWALREEVNVVIGVIDQQFVQNLRTILAETRGALIVSIPKFVVYGPVKAGA